MQPRRVTGFRGLAYLRYVTRLLQRIRLTHSTHGLWEAADLQWWWRKARVTDEWDHPFWFDADGEPVAAAVATDWGERIGLDVVTLPSVGDDFVRTVVRRGLDAVATVHDQPIEVLVDDLDSLTTGILEEAGFAATPGKSISAWMGTEDIVPVSRLADGYELRTRAEFRDGPHHLVARNGVAVEDRLGQTTLYRPDLDLLIIDTAGTTVSYGLFWYDHATRVGFVEPLRTDAAHRGQGLARHLLTEGIHRLAERGATRFKINYEDSNPASGHLYRAVGFGPSLTASLFVRQALDG